MDFESPGWPLDQEGKWRSLLLEAGVRILQPNPDGIFPVPGDKGPHLYEVIGSDGQRVVVRFRDGRYEEGMANGWPFSQPGGFGITGDSSEFETVMRYVWAIRLPTRVQAMKEFRKGQESI